MFGKFDRPGTAYDDAIWILNGFYKIPSYRLSDNRGSVVYIHVLFVEIATQLCVYITKNYPTIRLNFINNFEN